jgi:hypothetical protein
MKEGRYIGVFFRSKVKLRHVLFRSAVPEEFADLASAQVVKNHRRAEQIDFSYTLSRAAARIGAMAGGALFAKGFLATRHLGGVKRIAGRRTRSRIPHADDTPASPATATLRREG